MPCVLIIWTKKLTIQWPHRVTNDHVNVLHITRRDIYDKNDVQNTERTIISRLNRQQ